MDSSSSSLSFLLPLLYGLTAYASTIVLLFVLSFLTSTTMTTAVSKPHGINGHLSKPSAGTDAGRGPVATVHSTPFSFGARLLISLFMLVVCAVYGALASVALRTAGLGGLSQWTTARSFKYTMGWSTGVWFEYVDGEADDGRRISVEEGQKWLNGIRPAVFIGNHQTELDILMLANIFPKFCSVTAKRSLKWYPFLGQFMALSKTVFIDRANRASAVAAFSTAAATMRSQRQSVYIFPEGTRSYADGATMLPFKKGAFYLAVDAQVPIVPVVVANYANVFNIRRRIFRPGRVPVSVLPPIETAGRTEKDVADLVERARESMARELVRLTELGERWNGRVERLPPRPEEKTKPKLPTLQQRETKDEVLVASGVAVR